MNIRNFFLSPLTILAFGLLACDEMPELHFRVQADEFDLPIGPINLDLPVQMASYEYFHLRDESTGNRVPIQKSGEEAAIFILPEKLKKGESATFILSPDKKNRPFQGVGLRHTESDLEISIDSRPLLNYNLAVKNPPEGSPEYYKRSGFIHPLYSPEGQIVTNDFPKDHMHQHGIFFAWVNTTFRGQKTDFWNQHQKTGTVSHVEVIDTLSGPVFAQFTCRLQQEAFLDSSVNSTPALDEIWQVRVYHILDKTLVDISSTFTASTEDTLFINEYHYGGMAYRGPEVWFDKDYNSSTDSARNYLGIGKGGFMTSEGKTRIDGNHSRPKWVDMHGEIDEKVVGISFLDHPANFRYPQPVRLHPSMPYFSFSPMVLGPFHIGPDDIYRSQYRILVHMGKPVAKEIDNYWEMYAHPPGITWLE